MEIIDRLSAGDPEKKKYYIRLFLDTLEPEMENLKAADVTQPQEPIRAILHKLKSQVQTIGAREDPCHHGTTRAGHQVRRSN